MKRAWATGLAAILLGGCNSVEPPRGELDPRTDRVLSAIGDLPARGACDIHYAALPPEHPVMNLPLESRTRNYGGGSCVCASTISCLKWQGRDDLAAELRKICVGGQTGQSLQSHLNRLGIRFASTFNGDERFLEWCVRTRRGATIFYFSAHSVNLVDLTAEHAELMDNNRVATKIIIPRAEFLRRWRGYGGYACTPIAGPPAPPLPSL